MSDQICRRCERLLEHNDLVKAEVLAFFQALKSKSVYAISKPHECLWLEHVNCQYTKGDIPQND